MPDRGARKWRISADLAQLAIGTWSTSSTDLDRAAGAAGTGEIAKVFATRPPQTTVGAGQQRAAIGRAEYRPARIFDPAQLHLVEIRAAMPVPGGTALEPL